MKRANPFKRRPGSIWHFYRDVRGRCMLQVQHIQGGTWFKKYLGGVITGWGGAYSCKYICRQFLKGGAIHFNVWYLPATKISPSSHWVGSLASIKEQSCKIFDPEFFFHQTHFSGPIRGKVRQVPGTYHLPFPEILVIFSNFRGDIESNSN